MAENQEFKTLAEQPAKKILASNAFSYMFKDKDFWKKALLPIIVITIMNIASLLIPGGQNVSWTLINYIALTIFILASITSFGYNVSCAKNISLNSEIIGLDIIKAPILGLKWTIAYLAIVLPFIILGGLWWFLSTLLPNPFSLIFLGILIIAVIILLFLFIYRILALGWIFIHTENLLSFYKFKLANKLIKQNSSRYSRFFCAFIGYTLLLNAIFFIACIPLAFFHPAVMYIFKIAYSVYLTYFYIYLNANCISKDCVEMLEE